jgi:Lon protease-like protein
MPVAVDYPMLPLLDMTLFPGSETSLFVGRALSRASVEAAVAGNGELVVVRQREFGTLEFTATDLHTVGTLATVTALTRLPDGTLKITVQAHDRVSIDSVRRADHFRVFATTLPAPPCAPARSVRLRGALLRRVGTALMPEQLATLRDIPEAGRLVDAIMPLLATPSARSIHPHHSLHQGLLEKLDGEQRLLKLLKMLPHNRRAEVPHNGDFTQALPLDGFDPAGEPQARTTADGSLWLVFSAMPPSWFQPNDATGPLGPCTDLDRLLERATGCPVFWDSMKLLLIDNPKPDTVARIERFLRGVRQGWQAAAH